MQNAPTAAAYAREIEADRLATVRGVALTPDDRLRRDVIERVMCDLEVDLDAIAGEHDADPQALEGRGVGRNRSICRGRPCGLGWPPIAVTEAGRPFVRSIAALFDAYLSRDAEKPRHSRAV